MVQVLAAQWVQSYPCKTKSSQETERSLRQFLQTTENPKVNKTIHWNVANVVKTYHGIIVHLHTIDPRRMVLLQERCAE